MITLKFCKNVDMCFSEYTAFVKHYNIDETCGIDEDDQYILVTVDKEFADEDLLAMALVHGVIATRD
jgi:hypothetical protein